MLLAAVRCCNSE